MDAAPWAWAGRAGDRGARRVVVGIRAGVLALCAIVSLATSTAADVGWLLLGLGALAVVMSLPPRWPALDRWRPMVEGAVAAGLVALAPGSSDVGLLPYLLVAPIAAGVLSGVLPALVTVAVTAVVLAVGEHLDSVTDRTEAAEWLGLGLVVGLLGAWARAATRAEASHRDAYRTANLLLSELRDVARDLPTGLDEVTLAQDVLHSLAEAMPYDRASLAVLTEGGHLVVRAVRGEPPLGWDPESLITDRRSRPAPEQAAVVCADGSEGHRAVVRLSLAGRPVGVVALERTGPAWSRQELARAQAAADDAALRLDTAHLFSELRALATVEERRRLAREIHDGVAQEVAALGFLVDDLASRAEDPRARADLADLRAQLTRIVTELRLSIFDLRSDVEPATGLGAALGSYVRQVGTDSGMTVHLVLDESATRLPAAQETELLRIAQEAVTNARKHSRARNLWVSARVDPPQASLRVADDGRGLGQARPDSYGIEIMRERAARLGAGLTIRDRVGGGTVVEVVLDDAARRPTSSPRGGRGPA